MASAGSPPPLLSQLFPSPVPCPSASDYRFCEEEEKREANQGWREASRAHLTWGPPHRGAASFPGELWQLTVPEGLPKHAYFQRKPHTQNRTRFYQGLSEAYPSSDQIQGTQAHHHLPGRRCLGQWCAVVFVAYSPPSPNLLNPVVLQYNYPNCSSPKHSNFPK